MIRTLVALACMAPLAAYAVPETMHHQGRLTDTLGQGITDTMDLTFRLHIDASTSAFVWQEGHPGVPVSDGYYGVALGDTVGLDSSIFDGMALWLSISDTSGELTPRTPIGAVPYAAHSAQADRINGTDLPAFYVYSTGQGFGVNWSTVSWVESSSSPARTGFDQGNHFANNQFTAPVNGLYFFTAALRFDNASGPYIRALISRNGSVDLWENPHVIDGSPSGNYISLTPSGLMRLDKDDTISVQVYSNNDNSYRLETESSFSGFLVAELPPTP